MKSFCELSVDGLNFVDSMVKLAGFVEENAGNGSRRPGTECNWGA
jgi:hypothetical protein